jgi:DNA polymerase-3 subunit delta
VPKPVYALIGSDSFMQMEKLGAVLRQFPGEVQRIDAEGERTELADVLDELRSFAMFGSGKVVVVRDADAFITRFREQLEKYLEHPSPSGTLVLRLNSLPKNQRIYKIIDKVGQVETCDPPKAGDLPKWIMDRAKSAHQATVSLDAARLLAELIGDNLGRLESELGKLAVQADKGRIELADVQTGVAFQREQQMWDMTNQIAAGRPDEALRRWRQLVQMDSSAEFRAVTWLGMWLEKVAQAQPMIRKGMNAFAIGQALKIWPRELQDSFVKTAKQLGAAGVERALDLLVEVDYQSKTGVGDAVQNVERFLLTVGQGAKPQAALRAGHVD